MREEFLKIICGADDNCRKEVLEEVNSLLFLSPTPAEPAAEPPLIKYNDDFIFTFRKAKYLSGRYGGDFSHWHDDFCPICGLRPTLFYRREIDSGIFSSFERYAKCSCGFSWRYRNWRCPNCGAEGRENFSVYLMEGARFYKCKCGFTTVELSGEVSEEIELLARIAASHVD